MSAIGEALITARIAQGLTQEQLADAAGVAQGAISRYENGQREPLPDVVDRLAAALHVTPRLLMTADPLKGAWAIDAHLRRRATAKAGVWRRQEARLNMLRHHASFVFEEVGLRSPNTIPTFDPYFTEPEDAARMVRMQWRMPVGPVRSVFSWVESAGCLIAEDDFGSDRVDGLSQWIDDHPVMLLNQTAPTDRKRLTTAHELGHLVLHTLDVGQDVEKEANRFAAEFLMPAEVIRPQLRNLNSGRLIDLKRTWGVSMAALVERGHALGTITAERRTSFYKELGYKGWRKSEPASNELPIEAPSLMRKVGDTLLDRGLSRHEVAEMTGYSIDAPNPFLPPARGLRAV